MPPRVTDGGAESAAAAGLTVTLGRADDMRAEIVVRVSGDAASGGGRRATLAGTLVGPRRGRDMTLPTTVPLADVASAAPGAAAARAVFTEPAYWTPELPNLYRLEARLRDGDSTRATFDRMIGLRRLGIRGRSLWLEGRRWVPRGVPCPVAGFDPQSLRKLHAVAVLSDPPSDLCAAADHAGVGVVARLEETRGTITGVAEAVERIAAWALHPSVVLVVLPQTVPEEQAAAIVAAVRSSRDTMLVGVEADGAQPPPVMSEAIATGVDCIVVDLPRDGLPHDGWRQWRAETPLLAQRAVVAGTLEEHRRECDRLQAALAAWGLAQGATQLPWDWAGYLVS